MSKLVLATVLRGITKDITILDVNGDAIVPYTADAVRAVIGLELDIQPDLSGAKLVVTSTAPTANGSTFRKNTPSTGKNRLRLDASDLQFDPGVYSLMIDFMDSGDKNDWKTCERVVFVLEPT